MVLHSKACKAKAKVLTKVECKNSVALIKKVKTIHLQVLLPIKISYLPLTNHHTMLSGDSMSNAMLPKQPNMLLQHYR